jgi:hypothetical protein
MAHYSIYREQLSSLYRGHALWDPAPAGLYDQVRIGDIGVVLQGHFARMFSALLPADHPSQVNGVPYDFAPLDMGPFLNIRSETLPLGDYCSNSVTTDGNCGIGEQIQAKYVIKSQCVSTILFTHQNILEDQMQPQMLRSDAERKMVLSYLFLSMLSARTLSVPRSSRHISASIATIG